MLIISLKKIYFQLAGDEHENQCSSTFVIENEGHTVGNALKNIIGN
jgi:DNA-directed RNA polymerase subunit L